MQTLPCKKNHCKCTCEQKHRSANPQSIALGLLLLHHMVPISKCHRTNRPKWLKAHCNWHSEDCFWDPLQLCSIPIFCCMSVELWPHQHFRRKECKPVQFHEFHASKTAASVGWGTSSQYLGYFLQFQLVTKQLLYPRIFPGKWRTFPQPCLLANWRAEELSVYWMCGPLGSRWTLHTLQETSHHTNNWPCCATNFRKKKDWPPFGGCCFHMQMLHSRNACRKKLTFDWIG